MKTPAAAESVQRILTAVPQLLIPALITGIEERLFSFMTKYVYPKDYRFTDEDLHIFKDAVRLGFVSDCQSLAKVDYKKYLDWPLQKIREDIGIEVDLLKAYYAIEARRYPHIKECNRNLVGF